MILQSVTRVSPRSTAAARRGPPHRPLVASTSSGSKPIKAAKPKTEAEAKDTSPATTEIPKGFHGDIVKGLCSNNRTSAFLYTVGLIDAVRAQIHDRRVIGKLRSIFESLRRDEDFATHAAEATLSLYETNAGNSGFPASTMPLRALEVCTSHCAEKTVWQRLQGDMMGKAPDLETIMLELLEN